MTDHAVSGTRGLEARSVNTVAGATRPERVSGLHRRRSRSRAQRIVPALPCAVAVLPFLILAVRVAWGHRNPIYSGDAALLELSVRAAAHGHVLVGPYSRFGFFHPGPALFYLLSPFYWLTHGAGWATPFGVEILNATVAGVFVLIVQAGSAPRAGSGRTRSWYPHETARDEIGASRRASLVTGFAAALTVLAYALAVDLGLLQIFWNPLQIMLPLALLLVAVALTDGWGWPLAVALASATFLVQTDVSTIPVVLAALGCGVGWFAFDVASNRRRHSEALRSNDESRTVTLAEKRTFQIGPAVLVGLALVAWMPPLFQQLARHPGNLTQLYRFFRSPNPTHPSWGQAASFVGRQVAVFLAGIQQLGSLTNASVHGRWGELECAVSLLASAAVVVVGIRRRTKRPARLGVTAFITILAAVYSVVSIRGPVYWYLTAWMSALAVPVLLGWLLVVVDVFPRRGEWVVGAGLLIAVAASVFVAATTPVDNNVAFPNEPHYRAATLAAWRVVAPVVDRQRSGEVVIGGDVALAPTIAGVALRLEQTGVNVQVPSSLVPPFGPEEAAHGQQPLILFTQTAFPPAGYSVIGQTPAQPLLGLPATTISVRKPPIAR